MARSCEDIEKEAIMHSTMVQSCQHLCSSMLCSDCQKALRFHDCVLRSWIPLYDTSNGLPLESSLISIHVVYHEKYVKAKSNATCDNNVNGCSSDELERMENYST